MGKSGGSQMQVTDYYMSVHLGVCVGPVDAFTGLYIDDKTVWEGEATESTYIAINLPNLFGGQKQQGGAVGTLCYFAGDAEQVLPDDIVSKFASGLTGATAPGFRGLATFLLTGPKPVLSPVSPFPIMQAIEALNYKAPANGFKWSSNNPVIAQNVDARVRRIPVGAMNPNTAAIPAAQDTGYTVGIGAGIADAASHIAASINASSQYFIAVAGSSTVTISAKRGDNSYVASVDCP